MWIIFIYFIMVLGTGYSSFDSTALGVSISGFVAPLIALFGGSGARGSLYGTKPQKVCGLGIGALFFAGSSYWISSTGFYVNIFDVKIDGWLWVLIGFVIAFLFTSKRLAQGGD